MLQGEKHFSCNVELAICTSFSVDNRLVDDVEACQSILVHRHSAERTQHDSAELTTKLQWHD